MSFMNSVAGSIFLRSILGCDAGHKNKWVVFWSALSLFLGFSALFLLFLTGYQWSALLENPLEVRALMALGIFAVSVLCALLASFVSRKNKTHLARSDEKSLQEMTEAFLVIADSLKKPMQENPISAVMAAAIAGLLLSGKMR